MKNSEALIEKALSGEVAGVTLWSRDAFTLSLDETQMSDMVKAINHLKIVFASHGIFLETIHVRRDESP